MYAATCWSSHPRDSRRPTPTISRYAGGGLGPDRLERVTWLEHAVHLLRGDVTKLFVGDEVPTGRRVPRRLVVVERHAATPLSGLAGEVHGARQVDRDAAPRQPAVAGARVGPPATDRPASLDVAGEARGAHVGAVGDVP